MPGPRYFTSPAAFRAWLEKNHATKDELLVGLRKVATGKPSMTWAQSVDEALAFGWIDGVRKRLDDEGYTIRFTPRRAGSTWSLKNIARVAELETAGRMTDAGRAAFEKRTAANSGIYAFENRPRELPADFARLFKKDKLAWKYFSECPPSYRRVAIWWIVSAKRDETRRRRLAALIACSAKGERLP